MQEAMRRYADRVRLERGLPLQMRVGLNTGEVVVRSIRTDDLHTDYVPIGHATGLAARLQSLANPGSIVVSASTFWLTDGFFAFNALGVAQIKGVSEPVPVYEVAGVGPLRTRLQVSARRGLARFVGRQRELELMQQAWEQAKRGQGQIVAAVGEPGVGKSRLCYEFKLHAQREGLVLETFSVSHGKAYPYLPLIGLLNTYFQLTPQDREGPAPDPRSAGQSVCVGPAHPGDGPARRSIAAVTRPPASRRVHLRATGLSGVGLHLQARPEAGSGLQRRAAGAAPDPT
jgi:hypothetical protein